MSTRCKFYCKEVAKSWDNWQKRMLWTARFSAVTTGSEENKKFFAFTPSGSLEVQAINADLFEPGQEYYLDIFLAEPAPV